MAIALIKLARNENIRNHNCVHTHSGYFKKTVGFSVLLLLFTASWLQQEHPKVFRDGRHSKFRCVGLVTMRYHFCWHTDLHTYEQQRGYRRELWRLFCCGHDAQDDSNENINNGIIFPSLNSAKRTPIIGPWTESTWSVQFYRAKPERRHCDVIRLRQNITK